MRYVDLKPQLLDGAANACHARALAYFVYLLEKDKKSFFNIVTWCNIIKPFLPCHKEEAKFDHDMPL
jgi:hypothetical protein